MNDKEKTAVQWLIEQTRTPAWRSLKRGDIIEQAKAIERKQIEDAVVYGTRILTNAEHTSKKRAEHYFTSTFITE